MSSIVKWLSFTPLSLIISMPLFTQHSAKEQYDTILTNESNRLCSAAFGLIWFLVQHLSLVFIFFLRDFVTHCPKKRSQWVENDGTSCYLMPSG